MAARRAGGTFPTRCQAYDGPPLVWFVTACKARDGSYWAVQSWQRMLPNYGAAPSGQRGAWELRLSHWRGELARLEIELDWAYGLFDHLFGRLTYRGQPVFGRRATRAGAPLDGLGRNIYLDTFNSAVRARLAAREQLPDAPRIGGVLLRRLPRAAGRASRQG